MVDRYSSKSDLCSLLVMAGGGYEMMVMYQGRRSHFPKIGAEFPEFGFQWNLVQEAALISRELGPLYIPLEKSIILGVNGEL